MSRSRICRLKLDGNIIISVVIRDSSFQGRSRLPKYAGQADGKREDIQQDKIGPTIPLFLHSQLKIGNQLFELKRFNSGMGRRRLPSGHGERRADRVGHRRQ